jgi:predicted metalloprotease with PDZ domain
MDARMPKTKPPVIRYRVSIPDPKSHYVSVEMRVPAGHPEPLALAMAAWTPGSYKVRDFSRHVQELTVSDERGRRVEYAKTDKQTWTVLAPAAREVVCRYRVYANELGVRTSHVDDRHAHLNGASIFLYAEGLQGASCEVLIDAPRGWSVASALEARRGGALAAPDFDTLVDGPIELGRFDNAHFRERSAPHRVIVCGRGNARAVDLVPDLQKIVRAGAALFGGLPYRDYTFFIHLAPEWGGGLEHKSSASLIVARDGFSPRERYLDFLLLAAHEHFHAWNVKRLRPEALGPFDYSRENYTRMLWVAEGVTSYYEKMIVRRAKLASGDEVLALFAEKIRLLRETPGRGVQSLSDASFDAWIRYYQPNENTPNSTISYYHKGQLVAWLLDLEIRRRTRGRRSLDDVLRHLFERHASARGYADSAIQRACEQIAGGSFGSFFADAVDGVAELDFDSALDTIGCRIVSEESEPPAADLGVVLEKKGERALIMSVLHGGAAAKAGLDARDEILALDGVRVNRERLEHTLASHRPSDRVKVTVFRGDLLRAFEVVLGRQPPKRLRIERRKQAPRAARRLFEGWLGEPF